MKIERTKIEQRVLIRQMQPEDVAAGERLCRSSRWNQVASDWNLFLRLNPGGCRVAEKNGEVVGTVTSIRYEKCFSWLAMMLVDPGERHMGVGTGLFEEGLALARGEVCVRLDATPEGLRLYSKYGFRDEYLIHRLTTAAERPISDVAKRGRARPVRERDFPAILDLDRFVFGADREAVLRTLFERSPECAWVVGDLDVQGYCFGRNGYLYQQIGPIVARDESVARDLVSNCLASAGADRYVIDARANGEHWLEWLKGRGFANERSFTRMSLGENRYPGDLERVFGVAGPELG